MKSKRLMISLSLIIIIGGASFLIVRARRSKNLKEFREIKAHYGSIIATLTITGTGQPQNRLEIKPPIGGRIEEINVREGDKVRVGQILAWMSSTERAALLDTARSQGEEAVNYWKDVYKPTPIVAPINGEVIVRAVEPGQTVTQGDTIVVLSDRLIVKAQADETDVGRIRIGQEAVITLDAYPHVRMEGIISHISYESKIVNNVTVYEVDITPKRVPPVFRSGMSANVEIIEAKEDNALLIPVEAVTQDREGSFVFLSQEKGKKPLKQRIKTGISDGKNVQVVSGLKPEDEVLIFSRKFFPSKTSPGTNPLTPFGRRR